MKDLTIIIPVPKYSEKVGKLLNRALESCGDTNKILVGEGVTEFLENNSGKKDLKNLEVIAMTQESSYQHNVNVAVDSVTTKYFSVLEYDDFYSNIWFDNVEKYIEYDTENISGFLPLTEIIEYNEQDENSMSVIGYSNEAFWATSFSDEVGFLDIESLQNYLSFNASGAVFKTSDFISLGKLKESMKLVFWFEYLLRSLHEQKRLFVIPKVGYYHFVGREDSMTGEYSKTITEKEADWWVDLAKKEYFFKKDRNKVYEE